MTERSGPTSDAKPVFDSALAWLRVRSSLGRLLAASPPPLRRGRGKRTQHRAEARCCLRAPAASACV